MINYAAGYTLCDLLRKLEKSFHPLKEELVCAIMELVLGDEDCEDSSSEWVNIYELWHIKNETFMLFCSIEVVLRWFLKVSAVRELSAGMKGTIVNAIIVAFCRCMVCLEAEEKEVLLHKIGELWVNIRGFSFA